MVYYPVRRFTEVMEMIPHKYDILKGIKKSLHSFQGNPAGVSSVYIADLKTHSHVYFCDMIRIEPRNFDTPYHILFNSSLNYNFFISYEKIFDKFEEYFRGYIQTINKPTNLTVKISGPKNQKHLDKLKENSYIEKNFYPALNTFVYDKDDIRTQRSENYRFTLKIVDTDMVRNFIKDDDNIHIVHSSSALSNKRMLEISFDNEDYIMFLLPYIENHHRTALIYYR